MLSIYELIDTDLNCGYGWKWRVIIAVNHELDKEKNLYEKRAMYVGQQ